MSGGRTGWLSSSRSAEPPAPVSAPTGAVSRQNRRYAAISKHWPRAIEVYILLPLIASRKVGGQ
jgi:hypothetical protein